MRRRHGLSYVVSLHDNQSWVDIPAGTFRLEIGWDIVQVFFFVCNIDGFTPGLFEHGGARPTTTLAVRYIILFIFIMSYSCAEGIYLAG